MQPVNRETAPTLKSTATPMCAGGMSSRSVLLRGPARGFAGRLLAGFAAFAAAVNVVTLRQEASLAKNLAAGQSSSAISVPAGKPERPALPAGTKIYVRLETPVSTKSSHLHGPVTARVVREAQASGGTAIPLGAVVRGEIDKLIPSSTPTDRARVMVRFTRLEIPDEAPLDFSGRLVEVENARETVLPNGTIQGLLASELPLALIEKATARLGKSGATGNSDIEKTREKFLGKSDTSIEYPAGTDLQLVLEKPLEVRRVFPASVADALQSELLSTVARLLEDAPNRAESKDGKPGDPLNLVGVGSEEEIRGAFEKSGWLEPAKATGKSIWEAARAVIGESGYGKAPVSDLYLFGRPEDLAFAKMLNTVAQRHHLRLWRTQVRTLDGREIWLGAATHDTGYDIRPGVISHAIDADLDDERAKVGADLIVSGDVTAEQLLTRANPLAEGLTATGASWKTDGRLLAIVLKPRAVTPSADSR